MEPQHWTVAEPTPCFAARIAGQPANYIAWGLFAALLISGITTVLQGARLWRIGSGHILPDTS